MFPKQGIYCFGGKKENGKFNNTLKVLRISANKFTWERIETRGMPPMPRYQHTMNFYAPKRILIIYGGTDDKRNVKNHPAFYTDLAVLDLTNFIWLTIQLRGFKIPRCLHSACIVS